MFNTNKLAKSVRLALVFGAVSTLGFAAPSFAQEQAADDESAVEKIQVTGSRILNPNVESSSPVLTVEAELFDIRGTTDTVDLINTLPSFIYS